MYRLFIVGLAMLCACRAEQSSSGALQTERQSTFQSISFAAPTPLQGRKIDPQTLHVPSPIPVGPTDEPTYISPKGNVSINKYADVKTLQLQDAKTIGASLNSQSSTFITAKKALTRQPIPLEAKNPQRQVGLNSNFHVLDVNQGMSAPAINCLIEDRKGNIWMGTVGGGVSKYDGKRFAHFTTQHGLSHNIVKCILEDSKGNLWFGTSGGGLNVYDGNQFYHFNHKDALPQDRILSLIEDREENIWIGTNGGGVFRFSPGDSPAEGDLLHLDIQSGNDFQSILSLLEDAQGNIWMGTWQGAICYQPSAVAQKDQLLFLTPGNGLNGKSIRVIFEDKEENIWLGSNEAGISIIPPAREQIFHLNTSHGLAKPNISAIIEDQDQNLWIAADGGGVTRLSYSWKFLKGLLIEQAQYFNTQNSLSHNNVLNLLEDSGGNIWMGTWGGGINQYQVNGPVNLNMSHGLPGNDFRSVLQDKQNDLWIATWGNGLLHFEFTASGDAKVTQYGSVQGLKLDYLLDVMEDTKGNLWLATAGAGVCYFNRTEKTFTHFASPEGLNGYGINTLMEDSRGNIWFGIDGGGATLFQPDPDNSTTGTFTHFTRQEGLPHNNVYSIIEDSLGNIWLGTPAGAVCYTPSEDISKGTMRLFDQHQGLENNFVVSMLADASGNYWFGTWGGGLHQVIPNETFSEAKLRVFSSENGLNNDWIMALAADQKGHIWVNTLKGFTVLKANEESGNLPTNSSIVHQTLGQEEGLVRTGFSWNNLELDQQDRLWWGSSSGLSILETKRLGASNTAPSLSLESIQINEKFIDYRRLSNTAYQQSLGFGKLLDKPDQSVVSFANYPETLTLPHDLNHLTFLVSGIDWQAPGKIAYKFTLQKDDGEKQVSIQSDSEKTFNNLGSGSYNLSIQAKGSTSTWSAPLEYEFEITPPWWLSWWAILGYIILGLIGIWGYIRVSTDSLRKRVKEKTQEIVEEKKRSDALLLNILPEKVAQELKNKGKTQPVFFEEVSILFADFKGFTNIVASISGKKLVSELDQIFHAYDDIMEELGLEKIATIGDAYLAAGGLPNPDSEHAKKCVLAAQKIIAFLEERNKTGAIKWKVRIGIHTGAITAGVIGKKKFSYDLFGDTINVAARIESAGESGKINVSAMTYDQIKNDFSGTYRGKIDAKGKGELDMYFVD